MKTDAISTMYRGLGRPCHFEALIFFFLLLLLEEDGCSCRNALSTPGKSQLTSVIIEIYGQ